MLECGKMIFMKKILSIVLCFTFIFAVFYIHASAKRVTEGDFEYDVNEITGTAKITKYNGNEKELVIPDTVEGYNVTAVDLLAFTRCGNVENIRIGKNMKSLGSVLSSFSSLKTIVVSDENSEYSVKDNVLFNKDKTEIICYPTKKSDTTYKMPDSVETIKMLSFSKCAFLEKVELSENLKTISMDSFVSCEKLNSIFMSSKLEKIEQGAISECSDNLLIYFNGNKEQWNSINIEGNSKKQLNEIVIYKDIDENHTVKLTEEKELNYSSKVPFDLILSDKSVLEMSITQEVNTSSNFKITVKIKPKKSGTATISAVAENGFVLCNFNYTVEECKHSSLYFVKTEKAATCIEDGTEVYACSNCDYSESRTVKATGHTFGEWKVEEKATQEKEGLEIRRCNNCEYTESRIIPKLKPSTSKPDKLPSDSTDNILMGDVDGNKRITATDARKILRYVAGLEKLSDGALKAADVDDNNKITATDARRILRNVANLEAL